MVVSSKNRLSVSDVYDGISRDCLCYFLLCQISPNDIQDATLRELVTNFVAASTAVTEYLEDYMDEDDRR
jgi:hypothetical protein